MSARTVHGKAALLAALTAVMVAVAVGLPAMAALSGAPTLQTFKVTVEASTPYSVSFSGNTTMTLSYTPPWPASVIEHVYLKYEGSGDQVVIRALDSNGTSLGEVTVVPLASGSASGVIELAGVPTQLAIDPGQTSSAVWNGTITIVVQSTVQFNVTGLPSSVSVAPGSSSGFDLKVSQTAGPSGTLSWTDTFYKSGQITYDLSADYSWASNGLATVDTTGAGWSDNCTVTITASSSAAGTYTGVFKLYFTPVGSTTQVLVAQIDMVFTDSSSNSTNTTTTTTTPWYKNIDKEKAKTIGVYAAAGLGVLFVILLLVGGVRLRRSMIPAGLAVLIIAVIAMSAALAFVKPELLVGIAAGIGAFLVLVILTLLGRVKIGN